MVYGQPEFRLKVVGLGLEFKAWGDQFLIPPAAIKPPPTPLPNIIYSTCGIQC